jgi:DNA-binding NtrC family response regulator
VSARATDRIGGTILIVDDERTLARAVRAFLQEAGYEAEVAGDAEQALGMLESLRPDVIFSDVRLPGMNGIELLRRIREFDPALPVVIMTAYGTIEGAVEAVKLGAFDYLKKPVDLEELRLLADRAREHTQMRQELSYYRRRAAREVPFADVIGESPGIRAVLEQARQIAALDETPPVLISGETGTGKGLVARTIPRRPTGGPAVHRVNCTAPPDLMEAELFGHERGAFTDAKESKMGLFRRRRAASVPRRGGRHRARAARQAAQGGRADVRRLASGTGGSTWIWRAIATSSARPSASLRRDLYFRLAVILLRLPPLRSGERTSCSSPITTSALPGQVREGRARLDPAPAAALAYPWPGNVRAEPRDRAGRVWAEDRCRRQHLFDTRLPRWTAARAGDSQRRRHAAAAGVDLDQWERSIIEQALREAGNRPGSAATGDLRDTLRYRQEAGSGGSPLSPERARALKRPLRSAQSDRVRDWVKHNRVISPTESSRSRGDPTRQVSVNNCL